MLLVYFPLERLIWSMNRVEVLIRNALGSDSKGERGAAPASVHGLSDTTAKQDHSGLPRVCECVVSPL